MASDVPYGREMGVPLTAIRPFHLLYGLVLFERNCIAVIT